MQRLLGNGEGVYFQSIDVELGEQQHQSQLLTSGVKNRCKEVAVKNLKAFGLAICFSFMWFAWGGVLRSSCVNHNKKYGGDEEMRLDDCKTANNLFITGAIFFAIVYAGCLADVCNRVFPGEGGD